MTDVRVPAVATAAPRRDPAPGSASRTEGASGGAPRPLPRVPALDGLRVLAALGVVVYHVMGDLLRPNHPAAVELPPLAFAFFLISGFVIYRPFAHATLEGRPLPDVRAFYKGRLLRALPLWMVAVAVYLAVDGAGALRTPGDWLATFLLVQYLVPHLRFAVIGPAWALSVEWLFYLAAPLLAYALARACRALRHTLAPAALLGAAVVVLGIATFAWGPARPATAIVLGMGVAVFDVRRRQQGRNPAWLLRCLDAGWWAVPLLTAGLWVVLAHYHYRPGLSVQWIQQDAGVLVLWIALALVWFVPLALGDPRRTVSRVLGSPLLVRFAQLTFGIYLWHALVLDRVDRRLGGDASLAAVVYLVLLGTILLAVVTYLGVERPCMWLRVRLGARSHAPRAFRPAAAGTGTIVAPPAPVRPFRPAPRVEPGPPAVAPAKAPGGGTPRVGWVGAVDGLRAVGAFGVVFFHVGAEHLVSQNVAAVMGAICIPAFTVFFIISGFVLYRPWAAAHLRSAAVAAGATGGAVVVPSSPDGGVGAFWLRRAMRVYPTYWAALTFTLVTHGTGGLHGLGDYVQLYTLSPFPKLGTLIQNGLGVIVWTMLVEIAFYLYVPFHGRAVSAAVRRRVDPLLAELLPLLVLFVLLAGAGVSVARVLCVAVCIVIGMGFAVAEARQRLLHERQEALRWMARRPWISVLAVVVAWAIGTAFAAGERPQLFFKSNLAIHLACMVAVSVAMFVPAVFGPPGSPWRRAMSSWPMRILGPLTYGIYVWQYPLLRLITGWTDRGFAAMLVLTLALSVAAAFATYHLLERPIGRLRHHFGRTSVRRVQVPNPLPDVPVAPPAPPTPPPAPSSAEPRRGPRYVTTLDGLRALAAIGVVIIHTESEKGVAISTYVYTGAITGPFFMLFFAISGFVLYRSWARKHLASADDPAPGPRARAGSEGGADGGRLRYLARRFIRIYPLYWLVATVALLTLSGGGRHDLIDYAQVYLLLPVPHLHALVDLGLGIVVWTLLIDIVFYLYVFAHGSAMSALLRRYRGRVTPVRVEVAVLVVMIVAFPLLEVFLPGPWAALLCLPAGMLFAVGEAWQVRAGRQHPLVRFVLRLWWLWLLLAVPAYVFGTRAALGAASYGTLLSDYLPVHLLLVAFGLVILAVLVFGPPTWWPNRLAASKVMVAAGALTYGTYLWHPIVLGVFVRDHPGAGLAVTMALVIAGSVVLALVTYFGLERPLAAWRRRLREERRAADPALAVK